MGSYSVYGATVAHTGNRNAMCWKTFCCFFFVCLFVYCALFCLLLGFYSMCVMALIENHFNGLGHSLGFIFSFVNCSS